MSVPKFDPKELEIVGMKPGMFGRGETPIYNYPCTLREAVRATFRREPYWQVFAGDMKMMTPKVIPDNIARAFVFEAERVEPQANVLIPDMFGIEWEYIPTAGGSMVRPGKPFAEDAEELLEKVQWPDVDSWDWAGSAEANKDYFSKDTYNTLCFLNGWFERLISMMEFEGAIMALYDEDQKEAVKTFLDKLSDLYIKILGHCIDAYPELDGFSMHDDWGAQKDTFFSPELCAEMIVPAMRKVTDYLHSRGKTCELHSCGKNLKQVPNMIAAGWDAWFPQNIVDSREVYELYGDKILVGVDPKIDIEGKTDDEIRAAAREFVDKYMQPGKPCFFAFSAATSNPVFGEELYVYSRKKACGEV